jgi:hypothetical protein
MKENSKTGSEMGKAYGNSVLSLLKEIMWMIRKADKEFTIGMMDKHIIREIFMKI